MAKQEAEPTLKQQLLNLIQSATNLRLGIEKLEKENQELKTKVALFEGKAVPPLMPPADTAQVIDEKKGQATVVPNKGNNPSK